MVTFYSCEKLQSCERRALLWLQEDEVKAFRVAELFCGVLSLNFVSKMALREPDLCCFSGMALSAAG